MLIHDATCSLCLATRSLLSLFDNTRKRKRSAMAARHNFFSGRGTPGLYRFSVSRYLKVWALYKMTSYQLHGPAHAYQWKAFGKNERTRGVTGLMIYHSCSGVGRVSSASSMMPAGASSWWPTATLSPCLLVYPARH